jgi:hypothetical protein
MVHLGLGVLEAAGEEVELVGRLLEQTAGLQEFLFPLYAGLFALGPLGLQLLHHHHELANLLIDYWR